MQIHTVKEGESLYSIARRYSVPATKILSDNGLIGDRLTVGDELLILIPTRTVTVRGGDTVESISKRFDVKPKAIFAQNPTLKGKYRLRPGQILTVKQDAAYIGSASALGIIKKGCNRDMLAESLPYMTYAVIDAAAITDTARFTFDPSYACEMAKSEKKITLLGVSDNSDGSFLDSKERQSAIIDALIALAKLEGFAGIRISADAQRCKRAEFSEFILEMRKRFIGCDMLLFTEICGAEAAEAAELSDGAILSMSTEVKIGESKEALREFAHSAESSKVFVALPSVLHLKDSNISVDEAKHLCYRSGKTLKTDNESMLSEFEYTRYKIGIGEKCKIAFPSLGYIKSKLETLCELGFIGIAFDVDSRPTSYLTMFNAMFARADYSM